MYEYIKGNFIGLYRDYIVVENNGIGYKIHTSGSTIAKMPKINNEIIIYVEQIVREDFIGLYGFLSKEEIEMFNLLLTINGVGAKAALSLLSICSVEAMRFAISSGDERLLIKAPGIGKKIAQRIILELKDKIKVEAFNLNNSQDDSSGTNNLVYEATQALMSLGYNEKEAQQVLKTVNLDDSIEGIIKNCLKYLMN